MDDGTQCTLRPWYRHKFEYVDITEDTHTVYCLDENKCGCTYRETVEHTDDGTGHCEKCGYQMWDCDIDGHAWVQTDYYPPDCINIGERYYKCSVCKEEMMEEVDTIDHVLGTDDRCKLCGQKLK